MLKPQLCKTDLTSMKGGAIIFIVLHNLIHLISPIKENEFKFNLKFSDMFISHLLQLDENLWTDVFSFLGWYGICIFLFASGYGLVRKYEESGLNKCVRFWPFFFSHAKKLFQLMVVPYVIYLFLIYIINGKVVSPMAIFAQISMLSNLYSGFIHPGVYWFFGLMLQLYVIYYIFIFKKTNTYTYLLILLQFAIITISYFVFDKNNMLLECTYYMCSSRNLLHNSIGWLLPFVFGVLFARYNLNVTFNDKFKNLLFFICSSVLIIVSNINFFSWQISPIFAIFAAIYLNELVKRLNVVNKFFIYFGGLSAFLFAIHPLIRHIYLQITHTLDFLPILLYFIACVAVAICYRIFYTKLFKQG